MIFNRLAFLVFLLLCFNSCVSDRNRQKQVQFQEWIAENGKIKVLSTTAMINDLVQRVGGDYVNALTLIEGELDPHSYQLVKGDDEKLNFAQIIFYNGLELEHGPSLHRYLLNQPNAISLGDAIEKNHPGLIIEVRGQKDPHIWTDISVWSKAVPFIVSALSQKAPQYAETFKEKGIQLQKEMDRGHLQALEIMHQVPADRRFLVTSHDAFHYFARAYLADEGERESGEWKKRFAAPEGLAPESQLSVADIQAIIDHLATHRIELIFSESNVSKDSLKKIVDAGKGHGVQVSIACCPLYGDAMGPSGSEADTYLKMILYNARTLAKHMNSSAHESEMADRER